MTRTDTTEEQALWPHGGAEEDSCFREGNMHLNPTYDEEENMLCLVKTASWICNFCLRVAARRTVEVEPYILCIA